MLVDLARNDLGRVCDAGLGPADRADDGRALLEGDAHRQHRGGRARRGPPPARRAGRDVPRRDGDRRAEAPGDGADRRARADRARPVRRRGRLLHVRGRPGLLHHDPDRRRRGRPRVTCRRAPGSSPTPIPRASSRETKAKAAALLPAVAPATALPDGPRRRGARMILVVDHYDSFTYNLVQLVESLGRPTEVVKSDARARGSARRARARRGDPVARARATGGRGRVPALLSLLPDGDAGARRLPRPSGARRGRRRGRRARDPRARQGVARPPRGRGDPRGRDRPVRGGPLPLARRAPRRRSRTSSSSRRGPTTAS